MHRRDRERLWVYIFVVLCCCSLSCVVGYWGLLLLAFSYDVLATGVVALFIPMVAFSIGGLLVNKRLARSDLSLVERSTVRTLYLLVTLIVGVGFPLIGWTMRA